MAAANVNSGNMWENAEPCGATAGLSQVAAPVLLVEMTHLNPPMTPAADLPTAAPAEAAPETRRLPVGHGLVVSLLVSLTLWAGLAHGAVALLA